jgi:hypothetical protein
MSLGVTTEKSRKDKEMKDKITAMENRLYWLLAQKEKDNLTEFGEREIRRTRAMLEKAYAKKEAIE